MLRIGEVNQRPSGTLGVFPFRKALFIDCPAEISLMSVTVQPVSISVKGRHVPGPGTASNPLGAGRDWLTTPLTCRMAVISPPEGVAPRQAALNDGSSADPGASLSPSETGRQRSGAAE
jgi:hypothetical protein